MKLETKNIDKTIRTIRRRIAGLRCDNSKHCFICNKKIRKKQSWFARVNGMGGFNYYHSKCEDLWK